MRQLLNTAVGYSYGDDYILCLVCTGPIKDGEPVFEDELIGNELCSSCKRPLLVVPVLPVEK